MIENGSGKNTGMKRDKKLLELLLRQVEGEAPKPDLSHYTEQQQTDHLAQLIQMGYVDGEVVHGSEGEIAGAAATNLTPAGHDYMEKLGREDKPPMNIEIFISHNSKDASIAEAVIDLFKAALVMPPTAIRCTSVNGYKLPAGVSTDDQLRQEVRNAKAFIGLITPNSLSSAYVLFELGARWGAEFHLVPLLAAGITPNELGKPLSNLNALNCNEEGQIQQLVTDVAAVLGKTPVGPASYLKHVRALAELSRQTPKIEAQTRVSSAAIDAEADDNDILSALEVWIDEHYRNIDGTLIKFSKVDDELELVPGSAQRLLETAAKDKSLVVRRKGKTTIMFDIDPDQTV